MSYINQHWSAKRSLKCPVIREVHSSPVLPPQNKCHLQLSENGQTATSVSVPNPPASTYAKIPKHQGLQSSFQWNGKHLLPYGYNGTKSDAVSGSSANQHCVRQDKADAESFFCKPRQTLPAFSSSDTTVKASSQNRGSGSPSASKASGKVRRE